MNTDQPTLNREQQLWLAALRSGNWQQTRNMLCNFEETAFCCLGVAQALFNRPILAELDKYCSKDVDTLLRLNEELEVSYPGILGKSIRYLSRIVATLNDEGATFAEIADMLEAHWTGKQHISVSYMAWREQHKLFGMMKLVIPADSN